MVGGAMTDFCFALGEGIVLDTDKISISSLMLEPLLDAGLLLSTVLVKSEFPLSSPLIVDSLFISSSSPIVDSFLLSSVVLVSGEAGSVVVGVVVEISVGTMVLITLDTLALSAEADVKGETVNGMSGSPISPIASWRVSNQP